MHPWQSGHQLGAQSRHHPGASFPLARGDCSIIISTYPNNLKPVSTFAGEDHFSTRRVTATPKARTAASTRWSDGA